MCCTNRHCTPDIASFYSMHSIIYQKGLSIVLNWVHLHMGLGICQYLCHSTLCIYSHYASLSSYLSTLSSSFRFLVLLHSSGALFIIYLILYGHTQFLALFSFVLLVLLHYPSKVLYCMITFLLPHLVIYLESQWERQAAKLNKETNFSTAFSEIIRYFLDGQSI